MKSFGAILGWLLLTGAVAGAAEIKPLPKLSAAEREVRFATDLQALEVHRNGLRAVLQFIATQREIFPTERPTETRLLRREDKEAVWQAWQRFLEYLLALESTEQYHADWYRLRGGAQEEAFCTSYAAMLAQYRAALEWIDRAEHNPELEKVLNDAVPELGLPAGTFARMKARFLSPLLASQFAAREVVLKTLPTSRHPEVRAWLRSDAEYIWHTGRGRGEVLQLKNALKLLERGASSAWLPIQAGVSEWMGDTKVYRIGRSLVSEQQVAELQPKLRPGDVLLVRHEWYLSNVGLPGFWPHAALYIGTPEERRRVFSDEATREWVRHQGTASGDLEAWLATSAPNSYQSSITTNAHGEVPRIIEAISEGVSLTSLRHALDVDSLVVLRPRRPAVEKAQAIARALHYVGRPYDFNFDFSTDAELVCTELVYKSYEPATGFTGLNLPTVEMLGRKVTPANEIAKQFDAQFGTADQQFDLILFLDGQERQRTAKEASLEEFRRSWQRPKWHVLAQ